MGCIEYRSEEKEVVGRSWSKELKEKKRAILMDLRRDLKTNLITRGH